MILGMPADPGKTARLIRMLTLVQGGGPVPGRGWTQPALAAELDVDPRVVRRYADDLRAGGVPLKLVDRVYRIDRSFFLPPVDFTPEEAMSVLLVGEAAGPDTPVPESEALRMAIQKLRVNLPASLRSDLDASLPNIAVRPAATGPATDRTLWGQVNDAIVACRSLDVHYRRRPAAGGEVEPEPEAFAFDPLALYFGMRNWFCIGRHHGRGGEPRTLKLGRFVGAFTTERRFQVPADFSLQAHHGHAWRMVRGDGVRRRIVLLFDADRAETVSETLWHFTQSTERLPDGRLRACFEIDGLSEVASFVLGYGKHVVVEEPAELRKQIAEELSAAQRRYADPPTPGDE